MRSRTVSRYCKKSKLCQFRTRPETFPETGKKSQEFQRWSLISTKDMKLSKYPFPLALFSALAMTVLSVPVDNTTYPIYRDACKRDATFKLTHRNMVLALQRFMKLPIKSSKQNSLRFCARACTSVRWCKTFNYKVSEVTKNCQLLGFSSSDFGAVLMADPGWKHYEPVPSVSSHE